MKEPKITLYRFTSGEDVTLLTSSTIAQRVGSETYEPAVIDREQIKLTAEIQKENFAVSLSALHEKAQQWNAASADTVLFVSIFSRTGQNVVLEQRGRLTAISPGEAEFKFTFESVYTTLRQPGLRQYYQRTCNAALYSPRCGVDRAAHEIAATITAFDEQSLTLTIPEAASSDDGFFDGGMFQDHIGGLRFILAHVGTQVTISRADRAVTDYIAENGFSGLTCSLYPGCDKIETTCHERFSNLDNFRGFPYIPKVNPFSGSTII